MTAKTEAQWVYTGEGRGAYSSQTSIEYVGEGRGEYDKRMITTHSGYQLRPWVVTSV